MKYEGRGQGGGGFKLIPLEKSILKKPSLIKVKADLDENMKCPTSFEYSDLQSIFTRVLHNHAPKKKKILWFNNSPFMTKTLRKAIMHRSKLKNIYNKEKDR